MSGRTPAVVFRAVLAHFLAAMCFLAITAAPALAENPAIELRQARFIPGDAAQPPVSGGTPVTLPDVWRLTHRDLDGYAWYVMTFTLDEIPTQPLVLYAPHISVIAEFWLNGSLLNAGVAFDTPDKMGTTMSDAPVRLVLPSRLFLPGANTLAVRLQGSSQVRSGLSAITIGPAEQIDPAWRIRYALQVAIPYGLLIVLGAGLCFLVAYLRRQRRTHLLQFGLLVGVFAATSYISWVLPISRGQQELLRIFSSTTMYWVLFVAGYNLAGFRVRWLLPAWHALTIATLIAVSVAAIMRPVTDLLWLLLWPHILARAAVIGLLLYRGWISRSLKHWALGLTALLWLAGIAQASLVGMELMSWNDFRWSVIGAAPFCLVLLFAFAEAFILDREQAAVSQRTAVTTERERILQDMHDGMGAHLVAALHMARRPETDKRELVRSLEESLQDMRLIIDSLDTQSPGLLPLLANLRFRLEPQLKAIGIRLEWDIHPLPGLPPLTPDETLAVLRIVQEAVNNAIRHAQPRNVRIAARPEGNGALISISDDGRGFSTDGVERAGAHGLRGMRARAAKLGARLAIESGNGGTRVWLEIGGVGAG
ncbi:sensor histidine kinase [Achromobacter aloeverae]